MAEEEIPRSEVASGSEGPVRDPEHRIDVTDAYAMYMRYVPMRRIAQAVGCDPQHLSNLARQRGWKAEREALQKDIRKVVKAQAMARLNSITANGLLIIDASIKQALKLYKEKQRAPSVTEAEIIYRIVNGCHKMRITEQSGGNNEEVAAMSPDDVLESFMADPYMRKAFQQDTIDQGPVGEVIDVTNEDTISARNSERSASQEARALAKKTE